MTLHKSALACRECCVLDFIVSSVQASSSHCLQQVAAQDHMERLVEEIKTVEDQIKKAEENAEKASREKEQDYWRQKESQLRQEKSQLHQEELQSQGKLGSCFAHFQG